jgi:hypothetical protein
MSLPITVMTQTWYWRSTKDCQQLGEYRSGYDEVGLRPSLSSIIFRAVIFLPKTLTLSHFALSYYRQKPLIISPNSVAMVLSRLLQPPSRALLLISLDRILSSILRSSSSWVSTSLLMSWSCLIEWATFSSNLYMATCSPL